MSGGSPAPLRAPISNKIKWLSTISVLGYLGWLVPHAHQELNEAYDVAGRARHYRSPYPLPEGAGWVIDPRDDDLDTELSQRFYAGQPLPPLGSPDVAGWTARLDAIGLQPQLIDARADQKPGGFVPRLILLPDRPRLVIGALDGQWVAFEQGRGLLLLHEQSPVSAPALRLAGARTGAP